MKIRFAARIGSDLASIQEFIGRENPTRALSFVRELAMEAAKIGDAPFAFSTNDVVLRRKLHERYVIVYRASEQQVDILRILHGARDILRIFEGEPR